MPVPRDFSEDMVARLLVHLHEVPEGLLYQIIEPTTEAEPTYEDS